MRRLKLFSVALSGVALLLATGYVVAHESVPATVPINVRIGCDGENVGLFFITRQSARLSKSAGDTARFSLLGGSDVAEVQVRPKEGVAWPFVDSPPAFGRGRDASTGAISADMTPGQYGYDLIVTCGSTADTIDPNMDIRP